MDTYISNAYFSDVNLRSPLRWIYHMSCDICSHFFGSFYHDFPNEEQVMIINSFSLNILIIPVLNIE